MTCSRHFQRPLGVIVVAPETEAIEMKLPQFVRETQEAIARRYAAASLATMLRRQLRLMDTILEDRQNGRFIILCPEVDAKGASILTERIGQAVMQELGMTVTCGTASFPDKALTFEELVRQASAELEQQWHYQTMTARVGLRPL